MAQQKRPWLSRITCILQKETKNKNKKTNPTRLLSLHTEQLKQELTNNSVSKQVEQTTVGSQGFEWAQGRRYGPQSLPHPLFDSGWEVCAPLHGGKNETSELFKKTSSICFWTLSSNHLCGLFGSMSHVIKRWGKPSRLYRVVGTLSKNIHFQNLDFKASGRQLANKQTNKQLFLAWLSRWSL